VDNSHAYQEITDALKNGPITPVSYAIKWAAPVENSARASVSDIHKTMSEMLKFAYSVRFSQTKAKGARPYGREDWWAGV
jgi:hypothetical protein